MVAVSFGDWPQALSAAELSEKTQASHKVIILWYLGYLKRAKVTATVASAKTFVEGLLEERRPADWKAEQWRDGLNWFFRNAPVRRRMEDRRGNVEGGTRGEPDGMLHAGLRRAQPSQSVSPISDGRRRYGVTIRELQGRVSANPLLEKTIRLMRVRIMAYRTEDSYIGWIRRLEVSVR